jgi:hypothetical protein
LSFSATRKKAKAVHFLEQNMVFKEKNKAKPQKSVQDHPWRICWDASKTPLIC